MVLFVIYYTKKTNLVHGDTPKCPGTRLKIGSQIGRIVAHGKRDEVRSNSYLASAL